MQIKISKNRRTSRHRTFKKQKKNFIGKTLQEKLYRENFYRENKKYIEKMNYFN